MFTQVSLFRCVEELEDIVKKTYRSGAVTEKKGSPGLGYSFLFHSISGPKDPHINGLTMWNRPRQIYG